MSYEGGPALSCWQQLQGFKMAAIFNMGKPTLNLRERRRREHAIRNAWYNDRHYLVQESAAVALDRMDLFCP